MNQEELLLKCWRNLSDRDRERVFAIIRSLGDTQDAPAEREIVSVEELDLLLLQGIDSLDRGYGVEATEDWWEQERLRIVDRQGSPK